MYVYINVYHILRITCINSLNSMLIKTNLNILEIIYNKTYVNNYIYTHTYIYLFVY